MGNGSRAVTVVAAWMALSACNGCLGFRSPVDQEPSTLPKACDEQAPLLDPAKLDVLFVVDNSRSMQEEQAGVAAEMTDFVASLRAPGSVMQDLRLGVITTSVYQHQLVAGVDTFRVCKPGAPEDAYCSQSGKLQPVPELKADGTFVPGVGTERMIESGDVDLVPKFARLIQVGIGGSGQETPFEALRLALYDEMAVPMSAGGNGGFLRDGARLLIVVLTDEDDCSETSRPSTVTVGDQATVDYCGGAAANNLTPVSQYHDLIAGLKDSTGKRKEVIYAAIAPVGIADKSAMAIVDNGALRNIDCPTSFGAGVRHRQLAEMFYPDLKNLDSICKGETAGGYKQTLIDIAALAGVSQELAVQGVTDPDLLRLTITRADGTTQDCSLDSGGFEFEPATSTDPVAHLRFLGDCVRRRDDVGIQLQRLCVY